MYQSDDFTSSNDCKHTNNHAGILRDIMVAQHLDNKRGPGSVMGRHPWVAAKQQREGTYLKKVAPEGLKISVKAKSDGSKKGEDEFAGGARLVLARRRAERTAGRRPTTADAL